MAQQNIPTQPSPKTTQYMNLLGVDYQSDSTEISTLRSPDMVNMVSDLGGIPVKRYGYRRFGDAYEGVATIGGETWAVKKVAQGTTPETYKIYACKIDVSQGRVVESSLLELSPRTNTGEVKHVFGFQNSLYVLCEKEWIERDAETGTTHCIGINEGNLYEKTDNLGASKMCLKMGDAKYIPTVYTMYKPNGKELVALPQGVDLTGSTEGVNLLTPFRRVEYCVQTDTATETTFVIPNGGRMFTGMYTAETAPFKVEVLDKDTYDWKPLTVATDYSAGADIVVSRAITPDGESEMDTDVGDAKFVLASAPYVKVTESGVDYLRFKDDNTVDVPSGVPNVRITYAPFDAKTPYGESRRVSVTEQINQTPPTATVGGTYTVSGEGTATMTLTLGDTPVGQIALVFIASTNPNSDLGHFICTSFAGGIAETQTLADGEGGTVNVVYNGNKTITVSRATSGQTPVVYATQTQEHGGTTYSYHRGTIDYIKAGVTTYSMNYNPASGVFAFLFMQESTDSFTTGTEGWGGVDNSFPYSANSHFPPSPQFYKYDGLRTITVSQGLVLDKETDSGSLTTYYKATLATPRVVKSISYYRDTTAYRGAYKPNMTKLYASDSVTLFDARIFGGVGVHTYYSRASEPFKIDDNFYFDVDNDVLAYTRASRYLAIITEDIGRNTIFLASGEYDNDLAMMVYSVRASNAGVGAVTAGVSGTLNDEPLFLSRTGIYGISTNYLSEKYAISRSGKINKRLCREEHLETAVGIAHNNYFYIAINGNMYILDGRHRDASRNGDNSYECYFFDNMPIITDMFVADNRLLFSDGVYTYAWNDDLEEEYQYIDNAVWNETLQRWEGEPVACKWTSKLDGDGAPHYYKVLSKKGTMVTVAPPMQTGCQITIIKDAHDEYYIGRFDGSTFALSDSVMDAFTKKKIKKYKRLQFVIENKEAEPFGLISVVKTFTLGNYAKR